MWLEVRNSNCFSPKVVVVTVAKNTEKQIILSYLYRQSHASQFSTDKQLAAADREMSVAKCY